MNSSHNRHKQQKLLIPRRQSSFVLPGRTAERVYDPGEQWESTSSGGQQGAAFQYETNMQHRTVVMGGSTSAMGGSTATMQGSTADLEASSIGSVRSTAGLGKSPFTEHLHDVRSGIEGGRIGSINIVGSGLGTGFGDPTDDWNSGDEFEPGWGDIDDENIKLEVKNAKVMKQLKELTAKHKCLKAKLINIQGKNHTLEVENKEDKGMITQLKIEIGKFKETIAKLESENCVNRKIIETRNSELVSIRQEHEREMGRQKDSQRRLRLQLATLKKNHHRNSTDSTAGSDFLKKEPGVSQQAAVKPEVTSAAEVKLDVKSPAAVKPKVVESPAAVKPKVEAAEDLDPVEVFDSNPLFDSDDDVIFLDFVEKTPFVEITPEVIDLGSSQNDFQIQIKQNEENVEQNEETVEQNEEPVKQNEQNVEKIRKENVTAKEPAKVEENAVKLQKPKENNKAVEPEKAKEKVERKAIESEKPKGRVKKPSERMKYIMALENSDTPIDQTILQNMKLQDTLLNEIELAKQNVAIKPVNTEEPEIKNEGECQIKMESEGRKVIELAKNNVAANMQVNTEEPQTRNEVEGQIKMESEDTNDFPFQDGENQIKMEPNDGTELEDASNMEIIQDLKKKYPEHHEIIQNFPRRETSIFQTKKSDSVVRRNNPKLCKMLFCSKDPEKAIAMMNATDETYEEMVGEHFFGAAYEKSYSVGDSRIDTVEEMTGNVRGDVWMGNLSGMWNKMAKFEEQYPEFRQVSLN